MIDHDATTIPAILTARIGHHSILRNGMLVVAGSLIIAISARVAIPLPFTPVPMTMQPLAVLLVGAVLGSRRGAAAAALYLLEGIAGLPVFAHPAGLLGPTGGFLLAFPAAAFVAGWFAERGVMRTVLGTIAGMSLAMALIHLGGWAWLGSVMGMGARAAFLAGTAPFLISDLLKIAIAATLLPPAQKLLDRAL